MVSVNDLKELQEEMSKMFDHSFEGIKTALQANQQSNARDIETLQNTINHLDGNNHPTPKGFSSRTPIFKGEGDDAINFIEQFEIYSKFSKWTEDQMLLAFPLCLSGTARIWYSALDDDTHRSMKDLCELFEKRFLSPSDNFMLRQKLNNRKQLPSESVELYSADIRRRCQRLKLNKNEQLHYFVNGLKPELQSFVILSQPKTLEEAEHYAQIKSSVPSPAKFTTHDVLAIQRNFIDELQAKQLLPNRDNISAVQQQQPFSDTRPPNDGRTEIRKIIQEELRNFNQVSRPYQSNHYTQRPFYRQNTARPAMFNARGDFGYRDSRTTTGQIICHNCKRVGHHFRNCRERVDPRLPRRNFDSNRPSSRQMFRSQNSPNYTQGNR